MIAEKVQNWITTEEACREEKQRIIQYWDGRSESFAQKRQREMASAVGKRWFAELVEHLPVRCGQDILDIGTGSGFFPFLLCEHGHHVTGIDITPSMIAEAKQLADKLHSKAQFLVMDAENLDFPDESFDVILSRNLTWTLPNPRRAYQEWNRVLRPGGILLNFDGNYGVADFTGEAQELPETFADQAVPKETRHTCMKIKEQLEISYHSRPAWDVEILGQAGFERMEIDLGVGRRVYQKVDEFYNPTPLFMIRAVKPQ